MKFYWFFKIFKKHRKSFATNSQLGRWTGRQPWTKIEIGNRAKQILYEGIFF